MKFLFLFWQFLKSYGFKHCVQNLLDPWRRLDHVKLGKFRFLWQLFFCNHISTNFLGFNFGDYFDQFMLFFLAAIYLASIVDYSTNPHQLNDEVLET